MTKQELMALGLTEEATDRVLKEHVPYDRFKQVNDDRKALEGQLAERDKAIEGLNAKVKAGEDAAKSIEQLQAQLKDKDAAVLAARKDAAIQVALTQAKARNPKAALALLEISKMELAEDGSVKGLKEALEGLQKTDAYLFEDQQKPPAAPPTGGFNPPPADSGKANALEAQLEQAKEAQDWVQVAALMRQQQETQK